MVVIQCLSNVGCILDADSYLVYPLLIIVAIGSYGGDCPSVFSKNHTEHMHQQTVLFSAWQAEPAELSVESSRL